MAASDDTALGFDAMMSDLARVDIDLEREPGVALATVSGELDMSNARTVEHELMDATRSVDSLVVDLGQVRYLDSTGLALLDRLAKHYGDDRIRFVVPEDALYRRLLEIVNFTKTLPLALSVEEALSRVRPGG
jgi:anti-anti-sigma factor